jgi:hypothetical protein
VKLLITDGGPHPADRWAELTTESILDLIQIGESASPEATAARQAKRDLTPVLFAILTDHFGRVQTSERDQLSRRGNGRLGDRLDPTAFVEPALTQVANAFAASPFAAHFARQEVSMVLRTMIGQHFANSMDIERSYYRDRKTG